MITKLPRAFIVSFKDFYNDEGVFLSSSLAFFSILSIIPLSMFIVNVLVNIMQEERVVRFVYSKLIAFFPAIELQMIKELRNILASKEVSSISIILYGIFSLQLFTAVEFSLNKIFRTPKKRHFLASIAMSFFIILLITFTVAASFALTYLIRVFQPPEFSGLKTLLIFFLKHILPFLLMFVIASLLYKILPNKKIKLSSILTGAAVTTVLIEIAKYVFAFYVLKIIKIGSLYGSVSTFLALLMWLFYGWAVFLYGAELIKNIEKK
ncbi:membrane protein [Thermodesulfovibrio aggregans]|uniref:Membrane protein n=1 Tax=Thermodesulfovibrio aggregans TaxID=86166 RepID=A0A0U9HR88_9BACT|nr:YihY/virulence factor BrkB family protein [Thermodesulfovibrio aggregans]GAQ94937.1 membrane protein [Thermodesulfovibrio aggregans]